MEETPYQSPQVDVFENKGPAGPPNREKARKVAQYQRWVIFALLANLLLYIFALPNAQHNLLVSLVLLCLFLAVSVFAIFAIFMLSRELNGTGMAVLCAILMFVPCVSLITLLIVNQQATGFLKSQGIRVGFLGIDPKNI
jgi:hypothetical protein